MPLAILLTKYPAILTSGLENFLGGIMLIATSFMLETPKLLALKTFLTSSVLLIWLFLVVVGSLMGFTAYTYLLKRWGATKVSIYAFITPLVAISIGALFYQEKVSVPEILGTLLILLGIWVTRRAKDIGVKDASHLNTPVEE